MKHSLLLFINVLQLKTIYFNLDKPKIKPMSNPNISAAITAYREDCHFEQ